ncbi:hypothetical protein HYW17_00835 [Candidatus Uhrbacteria bacterium]|nr:hypothetical protein [Candidatus Uhrbacteria bacterium]
MPIFLILVLAIFAGAGITFWVASRISHLRWGDFRGVTHDLMDFSNFVSARLVMGSKLGSAVAGTVGIAAVIPVIAAVEERRKIDSALLNLEEARTRVAQRVQNGKRAYLLPALGELTSELHLLRAMYQVATAQSLDALREKMALVAVRFQESEQALFALDDLLREVQELLARAMQTCQDEALAQALQELAYKVQGYEQMESSFLNPELMRRLTLELLQTRQLLRACVGA